MNTRTKLICRFSHSSPLAAMSAKVWNTSAGGGSTCSGAQPHTDDRCHSSSTANGTVPAHILQLGTVRIGELVLNNVGAVVLPALIAVTEIKPGMSGKEFLTASVAGYEIGPRVGLCMGPAHIASGWHSGATLGVFSAAAGAARGLGLDTEKTVHALGIAGTQSAGTFRVQGSASIAAASSMPTIPSTRWWS